MDTKLIYWNNISMMDDWIKNVEVLIRDKVVLLM